MTPHALLFTLAAIGISETAYLIRMRFAHSKPVCVVGGSCQIVLDSKYNHVFGVHNDLAGLFFYVFASLVTALLVIGTGYSDLLEKAAQILIGFSSLVSVFFVYLQARVIKAWCFWCLMSAGTIWLMGLIVLLTNLTNIS